MSKKIIYNGIIINESEIYRGHITINGERISGVFHGEPLSLDGYSTTIDAKGGFIIPGVIDDQVHFREPGLTHKGDIHSESRAAAGGGVTSYMEMPNTIPTTTSLDELNKKHDIAAANSFVNYSFYMGASNNNIDVIENIDIHKVCGVKLFMGSSTGNMMVDNRDILSAIFSVSPILIATHCEQEDIVRNNMKTYIEKYGDNITASMHPMIRSAEACYASSATAVELAHKYGSRLHILHVSTQKEMSLFESKPLTEKRITSEVCVHHLWFTDKDYAEKGNFIKWNPAIKSETDRDSLRQSLINNKIDVVATDHAPHTLEEKSRIYTQAPSGGPLVQHSLIAMMDMASKGIFTPEMVVDKMSHSPALLFDVKDRGFLREGYFADIAIVNNELPYTVTKDNILYKCGWSPFEGNTFRCSVTHTIVNGHVVYNNGIIDETYRGKALQFNR